MTLFDKYIKYKRKYDKLRKIADGIVNKDKYRSSAIKLSNNKTLDVYHDNTNNLDKYKTTDDVDTPHPDKVLHIESVYQFDDFTTKYGTVENKRLKINWKKLSRDYKGVYVDKELKDDYISYYRSRQYRAPFEGEWYFSWYDPLLFVDIILFISNDDLYNAINIDNMLKQEKKKKKDKKSKN